MTGAPTLQQVRAWVAVPATAISDVDLQQILDGELAIQARICRIPSNPGPVDVTVDGLGVTIAVTGGTPGVLYRIAWGDTYSDEVTLDDGGNGTVAHDYADPGTFRVVAFNSTANAVGTYVVEVPGDGPVALDYPDALSRAVLRRCQRQIAAKNLPLGVIGQDGAEFGPLTVPSWDAEIRRLEASYRIPVIA